jgi:hypothetical protein
VKETSWVTKLIDNTPLAIIAIGLLLFVIGAAGGWPSPKLQVNEPGWRIGLAIMGVAMSAMGAALIWRARTPGKIEEGIRENFGIQITQPEHKDIVPNQIEVKGTFGKKPPTGINLLVIDFSVRSGSVYLRKVPVLDEKLRTWRAAITVGGNPGDERIIKVVTMGKDGLALWNYVEIVSSRVSEVWEELKKRDVQIPSELYVPGLKDLPPDIVACDEVRVIRK